MTLLAEKGEKLEHSLAFQIKEEHHIVPLKTVLRHYNIHVFDLNDLLLMDCIIRNILKVKNISITYLLIYFQWFKSLNINYF